MTRLLVTCPPMLQVLEQFVPRLTAVGCDVTAPAVVQTLSEEELIELVPLHDGWIIGDDPATRRVFAAGKDGRLRSAVKWGVGIDNVDFPACKELGIPITNTPGMFGAEVADIALGYVIALARETFTIDRGVKEGRWPKPRGISLAGKRVALVGLGDIGRNLAKRLVACEMRVVGYDPFVDNGSVAVAMELATWPDRLEEADFVVTTCAYTPATHHLIDEKSLARMKRGVRFINVSRGGLVDEAALIAGLESGHVESAALEVFGEEPLPRQSGLRRYPQCLFGSHNASNTIEAVVRTTELALAKVLGPLGVQWNAISGG